MGTPCGLEIVIIMRQCGLGILIIMRQCGLGIMIIVELLITAWARDSHSSGTPHDCGLGPVATCACLYNIILLLISG